MISLTRLSDRGLYSFPPELRQMIFGFSLHWNGKTPPLLVALRNHPLYTEAIKVFHREATFILHEGNLDGTSAMHSSALLTVQHLWMKLDRTIPANPNHSTLFSAWQHGATCAILGARVLQTHAIQTCTNLQSLHLDWTGTWYQHRATAPILLIAAVTFPNLTAIGVTIDDNWIMQLEEKYRDETEIDYGRNSWDLQNIEDDVVDDQYGDEDGGSEHVEVTSPHQDAWLDAVCQQIEQVNTCFNLVGKLMEVPASARSSWFWETPEINEKRAPGHLEARETLHQRYVKTSRSFLASGDAASDGGSDEEKGKGKGGGREGGEREKGEVKKEGHKSRNLPLPLPPPGCERLWTRILNPIGKNGLNDLLQRGYFLWSNDPAPWTSD